DVCFHLTAIRDSLPFPSAGREAFRAAEPLRGGEAMRKVYLGRTGLEISEIALGGGVTGGILINPDEVTRGMALRRAVAGGINWIDTATIYGNGVSEATIGRHIQDLSPR